MPDPASGASGEIAEVVEEAVESYFEDLTPEEIEQLPIGEAVRVEVREEVQRVLVTELFAGPLPPPAVLERYAALYPDAPRFIFTSFEAQGTHRRAIEDFAIRANAKRATEGLRAGFVVAIAFLAASVYLIATGHSVEGTILGVVDLVALVSVFVYGSQQQRVEREKKAEIMASAATGDARPSNADPSIRSR